MEYDTIPEHVTILMFLYVQRNIQWVRGQVSRAFAHRLWPGFTESEGYFQETDTVFFGRLGEGKLYQSESSCIRKRNYSPRRGMKTCMCYPQDMPPWFAVNLRVVLQVLLAP